MILLYWKQRDISLSKTILWSDGCASQFLSCFVSELQENHRNVLTIKWNYNEAHHGKSSMDETSGTIKNVVLRQLKHGKPIVNHLKNSVMLLIDLCHHFLKYFKRKNICYASLINTEEWPSIHSTLKLQKPVQSNISDGVVKIDFNFLSNGKEPCFMQ